MGSYQFEKLEGRQQEGAFLAERAQMRIDGFVPLLNRHGLSKAHRALEVGCGHGIRTRLMAKHFPNVEVIGVDRSLELLGTESSVKNLSFIHADLYDLPFCDESFDFIYARLVFMHLSDPKQAIKNLKRLLSPGGKILIEDADRDCMFFEPAPKSFTDFWKKVQDGQRRLGGDPNIGRKLASLLKSAGFQNVQTEVQPIIGDGQDIEFLVRTLLPSLNIYLQSEDRSAGEAAIRDLSNLAKDPLATFYHFWFVVSGFSTQGEKDESQVRGNRGFRGL